MVCLSHTIRSIQYFAACLNIHIICKANVSLVQLTGQPVLIGGTMGTCSYVLTGTQQGMEQTFGSTCHGAVSSVTSSAGTSEAIILGHVTRGNLPCCHWKMNSPSLFGKL